jgi:anti-anti-sigma regulatory factor
MRAYRAAPTPVPDASAPGAQAPDVDGGAAGSSIVVVFCCGLVTLRAAGRLDADGAMHLREALDWTSRTTRKFSVDLSGVTAVGIWGLALLRREQLRLAAEDVRLCVAAPHDADVAALLSAVGLAPSS